MSERAGIIMDADYQQRQRWMADLMPKRQKGSIIGGGKNEQLLTAIQDYEPEEYDEEEEEEEEEDEEEDGGEEEEGEDQDIDGDDELVPVDKHTTGRTAEDNGVHHHVTGKKLAAKGNGTLDGVEKDGGTSSIIIGTTSGGSTSSSTTSTSTTTTTGIPPTSGSPEASLFLRFIKKLTNTTRDMGNNIRLKCEAEGNPAPKKITWFKNSIEIKGRNPRIKIRKFESMNSRRKSKGGVPMVTRMGSQLQISNLEIFDKGFYACRVTNRRETIESKGVLDVRRDPGMRLINLLVVLSSLSLFCCTQRRALGILN